jgi:hypothetical protein
MTDRATCAACRNEGTVTLRYHRRMVRAECGGDNVDGCGAAGPWMKTAGEALACWDELMRPAIPEPLRELGEGTDEELRRIKSLLWSDLEDLTEDGRKRRARVVGEIMALPQVAQLLHDNERLRADAVYYDAVRRERDAAVAHVKEVEELCSHYQAETHALRELNERLEQADVGKLSLEVDWLRRLADVLEVECDEARREVICSEFSATAADSARRLEANRRWPGTGERLFPEPIVPTVTDRSGNGADLTQHCYPPDNRMPLARRRGRS